MKPILVVGSYNTGLTVEVERVPKAGETLMGSGYQEGPGGKGSNQAVAAKRLGARVRFIGCIGTDRFGDDALALWKREGVSHDRVKRVANPTGLGFVIVERSGLNAIVVNPGANLELSQGDIEAAEELFGECGTLLVQLEIPIDVVATASKMAKKHGALVIMNPAPAPHAKALDLSSVDIVAPNEHEFAVLTGGGDLDVGAKRLLEAGPSAVVVTLGERGAYVATAGDSYRVPAPKVDVVDSTGAGDAFCGALGVALAEGEPLRQAVTFANYAGALTVTRKQVIPALPTRAEVDEFRRNDVLE